MLQLSGLLHKVWLSGITTKSDLKTHVPLKSDLDAQQMELNTSMILAPEVSLLNI